MARAARGLLLTAMTFVAACSSDTAATDEAGVVNVYTWSDYIAPDTIERFEAETGLEVNYDTYDSSYIVDTKLLAGGTGYDVVFHAGQNAAKLIPLELFEELDRTRLPLWDDQDPNVLAMIESYPGTAAHSVIYTWGSTGFAYNLDMIRERLPADTDLESADLIFNPAVVSRLADCGVTLLDEADDVFPLALAYLGLDPNTTDAAAIDRAEELLRSVRPYVRYFSSTKMINDLPNQEVCVAMSWSGDYAQAAARASEVGRNVELRYSVPREGSRLWFDGMYIPADAPHSDNAYRFIAFIMRPDVIADITNYIYYANGMRSSLPLVDPAIVNDPGIYPDDSVRDRLFIFETRSMKEQRQLNRAWARIKSGL